MVALPSSFETSRGHIASQTLPDTGPQLYTAPYFPLVGWLLAIAFFLCPATTWLLIPGILSWSDVFLLAAVLVYIPGTVLRQEGLQIPTFALFSVGLLVIASMVSYTNHTNSLNPANCLKFVISLLVVPTSIMWCTRGKQDAIHRALWFWLIGTCLSALIAVLSKYGISVHGLQDESTVFGGRPSGLTYHANVLSYTCALLIPVAIYLAVTARTPLIRWICIGAIGLLSDGILVSGSRASILAVMASGLVWLPNPFKTKVHRSELIILAGGILVIAGIAFYILLSDNPFEDSTNALSRLFGNLNESQRSNDARTRAARIAYDGFSGAPIFGQGFEHIRRAHNSSLQILHSGGIVSFGAVILWWAGMGRNWWRLHLNAMKRMAANEVMMLKMFLSIALVEIVNGAFEPLLTDRNGYIAFGLMLGLLFSPKLVPTTAPARTSQY